MIAVSQPGKIGDLLYALPTARVLARTHGAQIDFYTSAYCEPVFELLMYQSIINNVFVPPEYTLTDFGCGGQPWEIPIRGEYEAVYHLGFRSTPMFNLPDYIASLYGLTRDPIYYECPEYPEGLPREVCETRPVVVGFPPKMYREHFFAVIEELSKHTTVIQVGGITDGFGGDYDFTGRLGFLDTASLLRHASLFVGTLSANLVLAHGFPVKKMVIWGHGFDIRHIVEDTHTTYVHSATPGEAAAIALDAWKGEVNGHVH